MPQETIKTTVKDWVEYLDFNNVLSEDKQKLVKFLFLWMLYNEYYNANYRSKRKEARRAIGLACDEIALSIYNAYKEEFLSSFKDIDHSPETRLGLYDDCGNVVAEYSDNKKDLESFLFLVYKIRCGFIHGEKSPINVNVKLISWSYDCLSKFLIAYNESYFKI